MIASQVRQSPTTIKYRFRLTDSAGIAHVSAAYTLPDDWDVVAFEATITERLNASLKQAELDNALSGVDAGLNPFPENQGDFVYNTRAEVLKYLFGHYFTSDFKSGLNLVNAAALVGIVSPAEIQSVGGYTDAEMTAINEKITAVVGIGSQINSYVPPIAGGAV